MLYFLNRSIPFFTPVLILIGLEIVLIKPSLLWWIALFLLVIFFLSFWQLTNRKFNKEFWQLFSAPFLFFLSSLLFFTLLTPKNDWLKHLIILFIVISLVVILESIFNFFHRREKYPLYTIENIYSYLDLITLFFSLTSFYSLIIFSNFPVWPFLLLVIFLVSLLGYQVFWANKILNRKSLTFILIISLIIGELFWIINFWPTSFYFNALFLTLFYYIMIGLSRYHLLDHLEKKIIKRYLIISGTCLLILLLTTPWG